MTIRKKPKQTPKINNWARKSSWKIGFLLSHIPFALGSAESSRRSLFWVLHKRFPVLHLLWPYLQGWSWTSEVLLLLRKDSFQRRVEERTKEEVMRERDICLRLKHLWERCHFLTILGTHKSYLYMDQIQGVDNGGASSLLSSTLNPVHIYWVVVMWTLSMSILLHKDFAKKKWCITSISGSIGW